MREFAESFFKQFKATVQPHPDFANELIVDLPEELVEVFGKPRLYLVFPEAGGGPPDLSPHEDLLVYGSRTFDQMMDLLQERGEALHLSLPGTVSINPEEEATFPLSLGNCQVHSNKTSYVEEQFFVGNYRVIFASDERQEEFVTVVLDKIGQPRPEMIAQLQSLDFAKFQSHQPTLYTALPLLLERAAPVVEAEIQDRIKTMEGQAQARLEKALLRLTGYYRRLEEEINPSDAEKAAATQADLQQDLQRKIADELERYQLRVTLVPLSYIVVAVPVVYHYPVLIYKHVSVGLEFAHNLHTNRVDNLFCHHCTEVLEQVSLCQKYHAVHPHCLENCPRCGLDMCYGCGIQPCAISEEVICAKCVAGCDYCDRWLNQDLVGQCAICQKAHCPDHTGTCHSCQQHYCQASVVEGVCQTCSEARTQTPFIETPVLSTTKLSLSRYRWRQAHNNTYTIYWGQAKWLPFRYQAIIVVDQAGQIVYEKTVNWWQRMFGTD